MLLNEGTTLTPFCPFIVMSSTSIISIIVAIINLLPVVIYFAKPGDREPVLRLLMIWLFVRFIMDAVSITAMISGAETVAHVVGNCFSVVEIVMIIRMYQMKLSPSLKNPLYILMVSLLAIEIYQITVTPGIFTFPILSRMVFSAAVALLAILYFFKLLKDLPAIHVYKVPMLWINCGLFVFFAGTFILFITKDYMVSMLANDHSLYWGYHNFLMVLSYTLYSIALYQQSPKGSPGIRR